MAGQKILQRDPLQIFLPLPLQSVVVSGVAAGAVENEAPPVPQINLPEEGLGKMGQGGESGYVVGEYAVKVCGVAGTRVAEEMLLRSCPRIPGDKVCPDLGGSECSRQNKEAMGM